MNQKEENELYARILETYGIRSQLGMLQEECAEAIQAVNKLLRQSPNYEDAILHLCEELADVQNMINQLKHIHPDFEKIRTAKLEKIKRVLDNE